MRRLLCVLTALLAFSTTAYAGQWQQNADGWRYQEDDGGYKTGWHKDADGKWYYFNEQTAYMSLDTITPDGYFVDSDGAWDGGSTVNELSNNGYASKMYDCRVELTISGVPSGPLRVRQLGYEVPVAICYDRQYEMESGAILYIDGFEVSKDGVLYVKYSLDRITYFEKMKVGYIFRFKDGTQKEVSEGIHIINDEKSGTAELLLKMSYEDADAIITSAEIYIGIE